VKSKIFLVILLLCIPAAYFAVKNTYTLINLTPERVAQCANTIMTVREGEVLIVDLLKQRQYPVANTLYKRLLETKKLIKEECGISYDDIYPEPPPIGIKT